MVTANKGEWSEFYAFLKILAERDVALADENLVARPSSSITFLKVYRSGKGQLTYSLDPVQIAITNEAGSVIAEIPTSLLAGKLTEIFGKIAAGSTSAFSIVEAETLAEMLLCNSIKAPSADKADIVASIRDRSTGVDERAGFSVKSLVGGASTLLNAGRTKNFVYEAVGFPATQIDEINAIEGSSKVRDRVAAIAARGGNLRFLGVNDPVFSRNLRKIDTMMPEFLAEMLIGFYSGRGSSISVLTDVLAQHQEFASDFGLSRSDFEFKLKQLLVSIALGMVPSKPWDGLMLAHGGYLVVKPQGELVCYHAIHRELFLEYLFKNTKFETPSTSRHDFGALYKKDGQVLMNLNLQIRFK